MKRTQIPPPRPEVLRAMREHDLGLPWRHYVLESLPVGLDSSEPIPAERLEPEICEVEIRRSNVFKLGHGTIWFSNPCPHGEIYYFFEEPEI